MFNMNLFEDGYDLIFDQTNINIGSGGATLTGVWVDLENVERAYCVILQPAGTANDNIVITPLQASSSSGTGSKALTFSRFWSKVGATTATNNANATGTWTQWDLTTPSSALNLGSVTGTKTTVNGQAPSPVAAVSLGSDTKSNIIVCEFRADSMDGANGFNWISMTIPTVANAATRTVSSLWLIKGDRYPQAIPLSKLV